MCSETGCLCQTTGSANRHGLAGFVQWMRRLRQLHGRFIVEGVGELQNYKRKISYFYQYHNGMVGSTAGFLKMEIRGDKVKIIINIQDPSGIRNREASLYLYHEAGEKLIAVKVDEVPNLEGVLTYQKKTDWMNVFDTGRDLYTFDGVVVVYHASQYFIGDFQDRNRKNYELVLQEPERPKKQETVPVREITEADRVREIAGRYRNPETGRVRENAGKDRNAETDRVRELSGREQNAEGDRVREPAGREQNAEADRVREFSGREQNAEADRVWEPAGREQNAEADRAREFSGREQNAETDRARELSGREQNAEADRVRQLVGREQNAEGDQENIGKDRIPEAVTSVQVRSEKEESQDGQAVTVEPVSRESWLAQTRSDGIGGQETNRYSVITQIRVERGRPVQETDSAQSLRSVGEQTQSEHRGNTGRDDNGLDSRGEKKNVFYKETEKMSGGNYRETGERTSKTGNPADEQNREAGERTSETGNPVAEKNGEAGERTSETGNPADEKNGETGDRNSEIGNKVGITAGERTEAASKSEGFVEKTCEQRKTGKQGQCEKCPYYRRQEAEKENGDTFEAMLREYPRLPMYNASELFDCVRIVPRDIGRLDMRNWKLGVNSFLTHGYYSYHYLLLGRMRFDDGSSRSIIGVPGVFSNREKYLANMFGFDQFIPVKKTGVKTGEFGYWIVEISPGL